MSLAPCEPTRSARERTTGPGLVRDPRPRRGRPGGGLRSGHLMAAARPRPDRPPFRPAAWHGRERSGPRPPGRSARRRPGHHQRTEWPACRRRPALGGMGGRTGRLGSSLPIGADRWRLEGIKAWCSGASLVTHALVDASTVAGQQLFAVDLADPGIAIGSPAWVGPGMVRADTRSVRFHQASGLAVGQPGQYLTRPGFWAGAIGVAACWQGGTIAVARPLLERSRHRLEPHLLAHLGSVHVHLEQNRAILASAARQVDEHFSRDHQLLAGAVRTTVERNAVAVMDRVGRALGPAPLAYDAKHAALVADLTVYIRQHHGERDLEQIGRRLSELEGDPWSSCE